MALCRRVHASRVIYAVFAIRRHYHNLAQRTEEFVPDGSDQEIVIGDGIEKFITLSQVSNTEVKIELKEFELFINQQILKFGDIVVDKCEVKKGEGVSTFTGQQDLTFEGNAAALGTCPVTVTGTVEDGNADMTINVKVPTLQQTVKVTYSGVKQVAESGGN